METVRRTPDCGLRNADWGRAGRMETVGAIAAVRDRVRAARREGFTVELVPTMGAFHEGHLALMRRAAGPGRFVIVSLFVNPTQFRPGEDLAAYPRDPEGDARRALEVGVDLLFAPSAEEMYPCGFQTHVEVEQV